MPRVTFVVCHVSI